jgi:hypothetical protein
MARVRSAKRLKSRSVGAAWEVAMYDVYHCIDPHGAVGRFRSLLTR